MRKPAFCICGDRAADLHLCFCFINPKLQASYHLLQLYSPVCIRPGHKLEDRFSCIVAHKVKFDLTLKIKIYFLFFFWSALS